MYGITKKRILTNTYTPFPINGLISENLLYTYQTYEDLYSLYELNEYLEDKFKINIEEKIGAIGEVEGEVDEEEVIDKMLQELGTSLVNKKIYITTCIENKVEGDSFQH